MTVFIRYLVISLVVLPTLSCSSSYQTSANEVSTQLKLILPRQDVSNRILKVEVYDTIACEFDRHLNTSHDNYRGVLLHQTDLGNVEFEELRRVRANVPLTISAVLSNVTDDSNSSICYFQPFSFVPSGEKNYEVFFAPYCEMLIFESGASLVEVRPLNTDYSDESCQLSTEN